MFPLRSSELALIRAPCAGAGSALLLFHASGARSLPAFIHVSFSWYQPGKYLGVPSALQTLHHA
jgi:hypothetical protein